MVIDNGKWRMENMTLQVEGIDTRLSDVETTSEGYSTELAQLEERLAQLENDELRISNDESITNDQSSNDNNESSNTSDSSYMTDTNEAEGLSEQIQTEIQTQLLALDLSSKLQGDIITNLNLKNLTVIEDATFAGDLKIEGHVIVGEDTAGEVEVGAGESQIRIEFKKPYVTKPIVTATLTGGKNVFYSVKNIDENGFDIVIDGVLSNGSDGLKLIEGEAIKSFEFAEKLKFDWHALSR